VGGLAASAPVGYYDTRRWAAHGVTDFTWSDIVTKVREREAVPARGACGWGPVWA